MAIHSPEDRLSFSYQPCSLLKKNKNKNKKHCLQVTNKKATNQLKMGKGGDLGMAQALA